MRCRVLPGNRNEASLVDRVQRDLAGWKLSRVVWVVDRGMAGENQRLALQRGGGQVIVGEGLRGDSKQVQEALSRAGRYLASSREPGGQGDHARERQRDAPLRPGAQPQAGRAGPGSTIDPSFSAEDVALGYKQLAEVERSFRTLKSTLDLRLLYHRLPERIDAHVLLCWLALLLVRLVETETGQGWELVRDEIDQIHRVELRTKDGDFQIVTKLTGRQRKLLRSLELTPPKAVSTARLQAEAV